jgi:hypothetical protein
MSEDVSTTDAVSTQFAAWLGTYDEADDVLEINADDVLFTDSLEEAQAWHASDGGIPEGHTLGITDRDGLLSTITRDAESYEVWCR